MRARVIAGLAIILTALALVPAGAHLFVLPNKIGLGQEDYFNWTEFRLQWEASLATNAAITFLALCCVTLAALMKKS